VLTREPEGVTLTYQYLGDATRYHADRDNPIHGRTWPFRLWLGDQLIEGGDDVAWLHPGAVVG
jgi:hypothetical protein